MNFVHSWWQKAEDVSLVLMMHIKMETHLMSRLILSLHSLPFHCEAFHLEAAALGKWLAR